MYIKNDITNKNTNMRMGTNIQMTTNDSDSRTRPYS